MVIWITGLSGSGKTTISRKVYESIKQKYKNTVLLDGDVIRAALDNNYGYTLPDRLKGAKQVSGLCRMLDNEGINVVCATISLFEEIQSSNRKNFSKYVEVFLDVDMEELRRRDPKKIYSTPMDNVVGVDLPYDRPKNPDIVLDNSSMEKLDGNISEVLEYAANLLD